MVDLAITCDEIIELYDEETKTIPTNFDEKNITCKIQNTIFYCLFIIYHCIIDSCYYLLLSDKILSKTKTLVTISRHK